MSSYFYLQDGVSFSSETAIERIRDYANASRKLVYIVDRPLIEGQPNYSHRRCALILSPGHKISLLDFGDDSDASEEFQQEIVEDLASISDRFKYKDHIGRSKAWRHLICSPERAAENFSPETFFSSTTLTDQREIRTSELLISLAIGSVNDIAKVRAAPPETTLEKIKRKITLFDGDQSRFIYEKSEKKKITIQGLSGTGKTELLLHKLKEIYTSSPDARIAFTCHNRILANSLRERIPEFFNFMRVDQQIQWGERLLCAHAWGSLNIPDSGVYSKICFELKIPFYRFSPGVNFDFACKAALEAIARTDKSKKVFDYMLIDESQDFPESFISLCETVTTKTIYVAGDIFQSIFDEKIVDAIDPDYLLSKCYRTDPRTLMFAHGLGMGLFEERKLRWLEDEEWKKCGYIVNRGATGDYELAREPLRRFEDLTSESVDSVTLATVGEPFHVSAKLKILEAIQSLRTDHPEIKPDDIGIILLDTNNDSYALADALEQDLPRYFQWDLNKAYETKNKKPNAVFLSNRNNVKGLEFPFIICIARKLGTSYTHRNAIYMTLSRSFIKSIFITSAHQDPALESAKKALLDINGEGVMHVTPPDEAEKTRIRTTIKQARENLSLQEVTLKCIRELSVPAEYKESILRTTKELFSSQDFDPSEVAEFISSALEIKRKQR